MNVTTFDGLNYLKGNLFIIALLCAEFELIYCIYYYYLEIISEQYQQKVYMVISYKGGGRIFFLKCFSSNHPL